MSERLNDKTRENLSAFVDGELQAGEQDKLTRKLAGDAELRRQLGRYQRISSQIQRDDHDLVDASGIADAVSRALADEPTVLAPRRRSFSPGRFGMGAALAATVAAVAVTIAPAILTPQDELSAPETFAFSPQLSVPAFAATNVAFGSKSAVSAPAAGDQRWKVLQPETQDKLEDYLLQHSEYAGRIGVAPAGAHVGFVTGDDAQH